MATFAESTVVDAMVPIPREVKFRLENGMYYAYFTDGAHVWRYFMLGAEALITLVMRWLEHGELPKNADLVTE